MAGLFSRVGFMCLLDVHKAILEVLSVWVNDKNGKSYGEYVREVRPDLLEYFDNPATTIYGKRHGGVNPQGVTPTVVTVLAIYEPTVDVCPDGYVCVLYSISPIIGGEVMCGGIAQGFWKIEDIDNINRLESFKRH